MSNKFPINLTIFDCDGTLVDSEYLNNLAMVSVLQGFGLDYDINHAMTHFTGLRFSQILKNITAETGFQFPADAAQGYLKKVRELAPEHMKVVEGVEDVVISSAARGKICVVSNGERNNVLMSLRMTGLIDYFEDRYIYTGLMAEPKPKPDLFLLAMNEMEEAPEDCLVFEDSVVGVTGAKAAGATCWGFTGTHHEPQEHAKALQAVGADEVFHDMRDVLSA